MFVYFLQERGFLDGDRDYLRKRLDLCRRRFGDDEFYSFYRTFLLRLFHDGLGAPKSKREAELHELIGDVPYLNGGLFQIHQMEREYETIAIKDEAFEKLFMFFEGWDWTLDYRPLSSGKEINPDVLGYLFEQYINNKQMGAYYTKEDVTGYITRNTLLPFVLDEARRRYPSGFRGDRNVWRLLRDDPDAYIYPAVQHTARGADGQPLPLPCEIAAGLDDVTQRGAWNTIAPPEWGLPTEIWRETVARRQRYEALRAKLSASEVQRTADLVSLNLDIERFTLDAIKTCEDPELLRAFWKALRGVKVLDPTCGSGAFLFAALERLETLYTACLHRMQDLLGRLSTDPNASPQALSDFRKELDEACDPNKHPNLTYFVLKRIVLDNLYGVDIMPEAVEVCKLRLFLKLAAQVRPDRPLEPLPDIDFNIRAGNALVGYATREEVLRGLKGQRVMGGADQGRLLLNGEQDRLCAFKTKLDDVKRLADRFREQQQTHGGEVTPEDKEELRHRLCTLADELDRALAVEYGVDPAKTSAFEAWRASHQPFHWFAEFYGVMSEGGFDVVIGNPPYVRLYKVKEYSLQGYKTGATGDLYSLVLERAVQLLSERANGRLGMIVPLSLSATGQAASLRAHLDQRLGRKWISHYSGDAHPSKLFEGVKFRLNILLAERDGDEQSFSSAYLKWFADERINLFEGLTYAETASNDQIFGLIPKVGSGTAREVLRKVATQPVLADATGYATPPIYVHRVITMFIKCFDFVPYFWNEKEGIKKSDDYKPYSFECQEQADAALAAINSSTFFLCFVSLGDCFHCGKQYVEGFPVGLEEMDRSTRKRLARLGQALMEDVKRNAVRKEADSRKTGRVEYDEFWLRYSKAIIDEIDAVLAEHYGFTDEELDFIINYDIKYRLGLDAFAEEEAVSET